MLYSASYSQSCVGVPHFGYRKLLGYSQGYRHYPPWLQGGYRYSWLQELHGVGYKCATGIGLLQDGYSLATGGKKATGILQVVGWLQAVRILLWYWILEQLKKALLRQCSACRLQWHDSDFSLQGFTWHGSRAGSTLAIASPGIPVQFIISIHDHGK